MSAKKADEAKHDDGIRTYTLEGRKHWAEVNSEAYVTRSDDTDVRDGGRPDTGDRDTSNVTGQNVT